MYYVVKIIVSAILIVLISEMSKRNNFVAALLASIPITSLLAFIWLYRETGSTQQVATLSMGIFWLVIPSLVLFIALPSFLKLGWGFWLSLLAATSITTVCYAVMVFVLRKCGINV